jgi:hypothetical protein
MKEQQRFASLLFHICPTYYFTGPYHNQLGGTLHFFLAFPGMSTQGRHILAKRPFFDFGS